MPDAPALLFREEQSFRMRRQRILLAIPPLAVSAITVWQIGLGHVWGRYPMSNGGLVFLVVLLWGVYAFLARIRLITTVERGSITVRMTGLWRQDRIDASQVTAVSPAAIDVKEVGGYGWRKFKGGRAYLAATTDAVRLQMRGGSAIFIGTERPADLARAINQARK